MVVACEVSDLPRIVSRSRDRSSHELVCTAHHVGLDLRLLWREMARGRAQVDERVLLDFDVSAIAAVALSR